MKSRTSRWRAAALAAIGALWMCAGTAKAGPGTPLDSITVTIQPTAAYAITITTATGNGLLGNVPLNTSTYTATASTVAVTSTYAWTGLTLSAVNTVASGGTAWSLVSTNTSVSNGLSAWALFTDTSVVTAPLPSVLTSSNAVVGTGSFPVGPTGSPTCASGTGTAGVTTPALFELTAGSSGLKHMECLPPTATDTYGSQPHLFLYFKTPPSTTDATHTQYVTFLLLGGAPL